MMTSDDRQPVTLPPFPAEYRASGLLQHVSSLPSPYGIGENTAPIRKQCCQGIEALGIMVDDRKNEKSYAEVLEIQKDGAPVKVLVVRTNEEREIAEQTIEAIEKSRRLQQSRL